MQNKLFYIESAQSQNRNWFSYVVNDPVNYIDPFGLTATDAGNTSKIANWWSNAKSTVKGWGQEIKADLTQTWNDIKTEAAKTAVWLGVNLLGLFGGFTTTQKLFNDALNGILPDRIDNAKDAEKGYGLAEGLKSEIENTKIQNKNQTFLDAITSDIKNGVFQDGKIYNVVVGKDSGLTDMEASIGRYQARVNIISRNNNTAIVNIEVVNDNFDFNRDESGTGRQNSNEFLTRLAEQANLQTSVINVNFDLQIQL